VISEFLADPLTAEAANRAHVGRIIVSLAVAARLRARPAYGGERTHTSMQQIVVCAILADDEIRRRVVRPVLIDVVNDCAYRESLSKCALCNEYVFPRLASAHRPIGVPSWTLH